MRNQNPVYCQESFHIQALCFGVLVHNNQQRLNKKVKNKYCESAEHKYKIETFIITNVKKYNVQYVCFKTKEPYSLCKDNSPKDAR